MAESDPFWLPLLFQRDIKTDVANTSSIAEIVKMIEKLNTDGDWNTGGANYLRPENESNWFRAWTFE